MERAKDWKKKYGLERLTVESDNLFSPEEILQKRTKAFS